MTLKPWLSLLAVLLTTTGCVNNLDSTQNQNADVATIQRTIDQSVWGPFKQAFESLDGTALNAIYAQDVLRVTPEGIDTQGRFKQFNQTRFDANIANGDQIALDFWFDSRQTNRTTSYDVGVFRMAIQAKDGNTATYYGQFHIVLKKINGQWKMTQDWDTASIAGQPITAEDFARKAPAQF